MMVGKSVSPYRHALGAVAQSGKSGSRRGWHWACLGGVVRRTGVVAVLGLQESLILNLILLFAYCRR